MVEDTILIIDDVEDDRFILKRLLKKSGVTRRIYEKENGKEAIEFFEAYRANIEKHGDDYPPGLIFLDINMPLMNGFEFLEEFKKLRTVFDLDSIVVVLISTTESDEDKTKIDSYDFVKGFVPKFPTKPAAFQDLMSDILA